MKGGRVLTEPTCRVARALGLVSNPETRYFGAMVGLIQPFFMMPCDGRKLR